LAKRKKDFNIIFIPSPVVDEKERDKVIEELILQAYYKIIDKYVKQGYTIDYNDK
jgi:ATP sulfurylase